LVKMNAKKIFMRFLKNHFLPALVRLIIYATVIGLLCYFSIWVSWGHSRGSYTWEGVTFNWNYQPDGLLPFNSSYENYTVLLDGHSHTNYSDGQLSPEQNILWHIANGYTAMILSDHNDVEGGIVAQKIAREKYNDQIKVIVAQEYSCCRIHMNLIGINQTVPSYAFPSDEQLQEAINMTHAMGGLVSVNHIPWSYFSLSEQVPLQTLFSWGVDFVEVVNQGTFDYQSYIYANTVGMGIISGTDMHTPSSGVNGWTTLILDDFSEEAIFEALKQKKTSIIYNAIPSPYSASPIGSSSNAALDPFFRIADFLNGYYTYEESMWSFNDSFCGENSVVLEWKLIWILVAWLFAFFVFFEVVGQLFYYCWLKYSHRFKKGSCCRKRQSYEDLDSRAVLLSLYKDRDNDKMYD